MSDADPGAARLPPVLDGLDASWSRLVTVPSGPTWHLLDTGADRPHRLTVLCIHGNPSWSYLWRSLLASAPADIRVIAPDQLEMGFSERTGTTRPLAQRIADLTELVAALDISTPIVVAAHDWGGPVSLGWARQEHLRDPDRIAAIMLTNTAVYQPAGSPAPALIRLARIPRLRETVCVRTPGFVTGALRLSRPQPPAEIRHGYLAPYVHDDDQVARMRRRAIGEFVADIPLSPEHPSWPTLDAIATGLDVFATTPVLLAWGSQDPVFGDLYLHDFLRRLPHASVQRFADASHFLHEEAPVASTFWSWLESLDAADPALAPVPDRPRRPMWDAVQAAAANPERMGQVAVVELGEDVDRSIVFRALAEDIEMVAAGLDSYGIKHGDRVAVLIPPGVDLTVCLYACWRRGAVAVLADAALGPQGITRAMRAAAPDHLIGIPRALVAARALRWPGRKIAVGPLRSGMGLALGAAISLDDLRSAGLEHAIPEPPAADDDAVVAFTSGSTGPSKGVVYTHAQLEAQRDQLASMLGLTSTDRLVAAFAPFALFGPALGLPSAVPAMDVTSPRTLTAVNAAAAARTIDATLLFGSPAALKNVVATASELAADDHHAFDRIRLVLSAGAPVPTSVLHDVRLLTPNAQAATPYGMTEMLPVANITLTELEALDTEWDGPLPGVCVGHPVKTASVRIAPLDAADNLVNDPMVTGEVVVTGPHLKDRYDRLWATQNASEVPAGWHRTGDVGCFDTRGRLWIQGRMVHLIHSAAGPVTPVALEQAAESLPRVEHAAAVGVGPKGSQVVVLVVVTDRPKRQPGVADLSLLDEVRTVCAEAAPDIAAVLTVPVLPTDNRHNSKIDRTRIAAWAEAALAGKRINRL